MGRSSGEVKLENIEMEKIIEFYEWLQGKSCPGQLHFEEKLNLTENQAFSVIYFLQEYLEVLPDNYERCRECGCIFDMDCEGTSINEETTMIAEDGEEAEANFPEEMYGLYCDYCRPD